MNLHVEAAPRPLTEADLILAGRHAPVIRFSANEPFLPSHVGVTIFEEPGRSPSSPLEVTFGTGVSKVIEYAIWWDWDIEHLYELEHIWLSLDAQNEIVGVNASAHGRYLPMVLADGALPIVDGRVTLYSEPGKHAFHAERQNLLASRDRLIECCTAPRGYILINEMFADAFAAIGPADHRAVKRHLQDIAFVPSFDFGQIFDLATVTFVSWEQLTDHIRLRVPQVLAEVRARVPLLKAVFIDSGDTMIDEATEIRDQDGYVVKAGLIPGVAEAIEAIASEGYRLVLVADGLKKSFDNILSANGIKPYLEAEIISEIMGCEKPDARMFDAALEAIGLTSSDVGEVVMIGNHLGRDVRGANARGIVSIWLNWSPRREKLPADAMEVPDFVARTPGELPLILEHIERDMVRRGHGAGLAATLKGAN